MTSYTRGVAQDDPVNVAKIVMTGPFYANTLNNVTAKAGGVQANGTLLSGDVNIITVCATLNDSVLLPTAEAGREITVFNSGAAAASVFPGVGDKINALSANASINIAAGKAVTFYGAALLAWVSLAGA